MKFGTKHKWKIIAEYCVAWTLAFTFLSIVRGVGTKEIGTLEFGFGASMLLSITLGPFMGLVSGYAQIITEERIYKRISIQRLLFFRFIYAVFIVTFLIVLAYLAYQLYFGTEMGLVEFAMGSGSFAVYFFVLSTDLFLVTLRQVNLMLGPGNLGRLLQGKFYSPSEEERIFMFLDLHSSTKHAEKLGHIKYSMMIQDCFDDLSVVIETEAQIYQYVGDEVVLTWKLKNGLKRQNCLKAFYRFKEQLQKRSEYYESRYQTIPFFKAGLHAGLVTVTEVGRYKKEIAYHGDTMNSTARIQGRCNDFGEELLISDYLLELLNVDHYEFNYIGEVALKGKQQPMKIHSVSHGIETSKMAI